MYPEKGIFADFGVRLRSERERLGLNQTDFGGLGGVKRNAEVAYEAGRSFPTLDYLFALAEHGVDAGYVVTGVRTEGLFLQNDQEFDLIGYFRNLKAEDRDTVFALVNHFLARDADQTWANASPPTATQSSALHSPKMSFRSEDDV